MKAKLVFGRSSIYDISGQAPEEGVLRAAK